MSKEKDWNVKNELQSYAE